MSGKDKQVIGVKQLNAGSQATGSLQVGSLKARSSKIITFKLPQGHKQDEPISFNYNEFWHFYKKTPGQAGSRSTLKDAGFKPDKHQALVFKAIKEDEAKDLKMMVNNHMIRRCVEQSNSIPKTPIVLRCDDPYRIYLLMHKSRDMAWDNLIELRSLP